jgi:hypothetical protein
MNDVHGDNEPHSDGGRVHVHATVDHLASDFGNSAKLSVRLDPAAKQSTE